MYDKIFERGKIGNLHLKNRIVMPPMGTNIVRSDCKPNPEIIGFYEARAKGGCGLIITEISRIDEGAGKGMGGQLSVTSTKHIQDLVELTEAVHKYDTKIFLQLQHPGREASSRALGCQSVAPSPLPCKLVGEIPHELTIEECEDLVKKFVTGAVYAKMAGFDGVEIHAAHGYLVNEFLSPYSNVRTDKYGGSFEGRLQFIKEIIFGIKAACGKNFPVSVRISADEYYEGGITLEEGVKICQALESFGVDALDVSAGIYESGHATIEPQQLPEGFKKHVATAVKKAVNIPVIAVNNIKYPATAEKYLEEGVSDFVGIARGHIADAEWGNKAKTGNDISLRKCIGCLECFKCYNKCHQVECTVNPLVGREYLFNDDNLKKDGNGRLVCVVGAGPAGMQAAMVLAKRGFKVQLFDKNDKLGGTVNLAALPPHKELLGELIKTMAFELENCGVELKLGKAVDPADLKALDPYGVVVAVGGNTIVPAFKGAETNSVCTAEDYLSGKVEIKGKKVAVIGGGVTGLETSELLAADNKVNVIEMQSKAGDSLYATVKLFLLGGLQQAGVVIKCSEKLTEITSEGVKTVNTKTNEESLTEADQVVLALGVSDNNDYAESFYDVFDKVTVVGDAEKGGQIMDALKSANDKAWVF